MKPLPPTGVPPKIRFKGKWFDFDCICGTGEPLYVRREGKDEQVRIHVVHTKDLNAHRCMGSGM